MQDLRYVRTFPVWQNFVKNNINARLIADFWDAHVINLQNVAILVSLNTQLRMIKNSIQQ